MKIFDRLFRREQINGNSRCPTYLIRWTLFQPRRPRALWRGFGIYVHKFVGDDWSLDLHDHPKRFISIGLKGSYCEHTPSPDPNAWSGRWEVAVDNDGEMVRVRWSERDDRGYWFYCRHYPNTGWGRNACDGEAKRMNADGRVPWQDAEFRPSPPTVTRIYRAPWLRTFPADHIHRIELLSDRRPCWTLVIVLAHVREWGFWHRGMFQPWRSYVTPGNPIADERKACR